MEGRLLRALVDCNVDAPGFIDYVRMGAGAALGGVIVFALVGLILWGVWATWGGDEA